MLLLVENEVVAINYALVHVYIFTFYVDYKCEMCIRKNPGIGCFMQFLQVLALFVARCGKR